MKKLLRKVRSKILSQRFLKNRDVPYEAVYMMPYRGGSVYMSEELNGFNLYITSSHGLLYFVMKIKADKNLTNFIFTDFISKSDPRSFRAVVLRNLINAETNPSLIYTFIESKGVISNKESFKYLNHVDNISFRKALTRYENTLDKLSLLADLESKGYYKLFKYTDQVHKFLYDYFVKWLKNNDDTELIEKAEKIAVTLQDSLKESNSYNEYKENCSAANVPKNCILCLPALSKSFALALVRSNTLLKEFHDRPKGSDLMGVLHTTEKDIVGLKIGFAPMKNGRDISITVGTAFINHDSITKTKDVEL